MSLHVRENNFDLLRIFCMLCVVILHTSSQCIIPAEKAYGAVLEEVLFFNVFSRMAVPCFIMISGAFLLAKPAIDIQKFYQKTWQRLGKPTVFVSIACFAYVVLKSALLAYFDQLPVSFAEKIITLFWNTLNGAPYYHLWYMYMLFGLYMVTPLLLAIKKNLSQGQYLALTIVFLLAGVGQHHTGAVFWLFDWVQYVGYFMCGNCIKERAAALPLPKGVWAGASLVLLLLAWGITCVYTQYLHLDMHTALFAPFASLKSHAYDFFIVPNAEIIIAASVCFFIFFARLSVQRSYAKAADLTFFLYLVHAPVLDVLMTIHNAIQPRMQHVLVHMCTLAVLTLVFSSVLAWKMRQAFTLE